MGCGLKALEVAPHAEAEQVWNWPVLRVETFLGTHLDAIWSSSTEERWERNVIKQKENFS